MLDWFFRVDEKVDMNELHNVADVEGRVQDNIRWLEAPLGDTAFQPWVP